MSRRHENASSSSSFGQPLFAGTLIGEAIERTGSWRSDEPLHLQGLPVSAASAPMCPFFGNMVCAPAAGDTEEECSCTQAAMYEKKRF